MIRRRGAGAFAIGLLLTACLSGDNGARDVPATFEPVPSTTTVTPSGRVLGIVGCDSAPAEAEVLCEAFELVRSRYVDQVGDEVLAEAAALGLELLDGADDDSELVCVAPAQEFAEICPLAADEAETTAEAAEAMVFGMATFGLDPNSAYLDPETLALVEEEQAGSIEGIGALVTAEDRSTGEPVQCGVVSVTCRLIIVSTITGAPAEAAGLEPEDVVVAVDAEDIEGWTVDAITATVRGSAGSDVTLTILRAGERFDVTITRAAVEIPVVESALVGDVGYVRLNQFTNNADEQLQEVVFDLLTEGIDTLVMDLRDNPGGLLDTAVEVTSQFLADGDVVQTQSPDSFRTYQALGNPIVPGEIEVVVVVNRGSASASELFSAVLQERGRAVVVGERTFGKNTVQQRFGLSNGGALKLTIARWLTPGGLDFGGTGVTPDVTLDFTPALTPEAVVNLALSRS
jgi:carboxyl-terminal processing protease